ncbi:MAG: uroporphyrinogen decarboxylase family protein [Candidatus Brocadiia bacterium]
MKISVDYLADRETDARLKEYLNAESEKELLDHLGCDFFYLPGRDISQNEGFLPFYKGKLPEMTDGKRVCPLGIRWHRGAYDSKFSVDEAIGGPFEDPSITAREVLDYSWPEPADFDFSPLVAEAVKNADRTRIGGLWTGIMGDAYRMHGFEKFLLNLTVNPDLIHTLIDRMTEMYLKLNEAYFSELKEHFEIWFFGNDFGSQNGLLMSTEMWTDFFFENIRKLCALAHSYDLKVMMHSCGAISELIPLLVEAGVDILDPIQVTAEGMDPAALAEKHGGTITFHGGIDTQNVLPFGSLQEVGEHVREVVGTFAETGRYIFAPSQLLGSDIPLENIVGMYRTIERINLERQAESDVSLAGA